MASCRFINTDPSRKRCRAVWKTFVVAEMVPRVCRVLDAIEAEDWEFLHGLLAPEVHWTTAIEDQLHGPDAVVEAFKLDPPPAPPSWHEADDQGRITRWIDCPG